jgi:flavin-dependent dehydrogenase
VTYVEVIIVGGGPAGSSCARRLRQLGIECLILDKEVFPRTKLCAGWITPAVVADLDIDVSGYPHGFLTFERTRVHVVGLSFAMRSPQYSIRRCEFDQWLLERAGAPVITHEVRQISPCNVGYSIDDKFRCRYLVGAGGTRCPVYRSLFRGDSPRAADLQVATLEHELPSTWADGDCHLWFLKRGLPGYAWYVPKADGYLNLGIGAAALRVGGGARLKAHWQVFASALRRCGLVDEAIPAPKGYSYFLRDQIDIGRSGDAFVVGDAAGLATRDLCEGIGPAVRSGIRAAESIATGAPFTLADIPAYSLGDGLMGQALEYAILRRTRARHSRRP